MNIDVLGAELSDDPLGRTYSGMTDKEATDSLNAVDRIIADSTRRSFRDLLRAEGLSVAGTIYGKLKTAAETSAGVELAVSAANDYSDNGGLDFSHAQTISGLNGLVSAVLTQDEANKLKALGTRTVSRATELGLGTVRVGNVEEARRGN